jgi:hypothetical protein
MYISIINTISPRRRFYDLHGSGESSSSILFIIHTATAILPSSTIFGTNFWVRTEIPLWMMLSPEPSLTRGLVDQRLPCRQQDAAGEPGHAVDGIHDAERSCAPLLRS